MSEFENQTGVLIVSVVALFIWLLKNSFEFIFNYYSTKLSSRRVNAKLIEDKETELHLIELQNKSDREEKLEDLKLKRQMDRDSLNDGIKMLNIMKSLRESCNGVSVSLAAFHNSVAKNYKNFSIRFQEARDVSMETKNHYQTCPLSGYYEDISKFQTKDYIVYDINKTPSLKNKAFLRKHNITTLFMFPILIPVNEGNEDVENVMSIVKKGKEYLILGCVLMSLDNSSSKDSNTVIANKMKEKVAAMIEIYNQNKLVLT